ncbi:Uncharacterised protein [Leminorella grimontii]|nr:Uncharacterised protein [Leminorella grimontii]
MFSVEMVMMMDGTFSRLTSRALTSPSSRPMPPLSANASAKLPVVF